MQEITVPLNPNEKLISKSISITVDGTSTITFYTVDKAGNVSDPKIVTVHKDAKAPENVNLEVGTAYPTKLKVTATADDKTSGITKYEFYVRKPGETQFTKVSTENWKLNSYKYIYENLPLGQTSMYVRVYDEAGNYTDSQVKTGNALAELSSSAPTIVVEGTGPINDCYTSNVKVKITPGRFTSGVTSEGGVINSASWIGNVRYSVSGATEIALTEGERNSPVEFELSKNGISTISAYTFDNWGNVSEQRTIEVTISKNLIDPESPDYPSTNPVQLSINTSGTLGENGYYKTPVTVTISARSNITEIMGIKFKVEGAEVVKERTIQGTTKQFTIRTDGTSTVTACAIDKVGNTSMPITKEIKKDQTAPNLNVTVGAATTTTIPVTISAEEKISGIASYKFEYKLVSQSAWITKETIKTDKEIYDYVYTGLNEKTSYNIRITAIDKAGNTKVSNTYTVETEKIPDTTPPSAPTITSNGMNGTNGWYKSEAIVRITPGQDSDSGVKGVKYWISGAQKQEEIITDSAASVSRTITSEGTSTIYAKTIDKSGNISGTSSKEVKIDTKVPSVANLKVNESKIGTNTIPVLAEGKDTTSGIYSYKFEYKKQGSTRWLTADTKRSSNETCSYIYSVGIEEGKAYDLRVTVIDAAGNERMSQIVQAETVDVNSPNVPRIDINATPGNNGWYRSNVMINITPGKDKGSGIQGVGYKIYKKDSETKQIPEPGKIVVTEKASETILMQDPNTNMKTTKSIQIADREGDGTYRVEAWTIDNRGNTSKVITKEFKKDAKLPEASKPVLTDDEIGAKTATVKVTGSDALTGIASYYFDYRKTGSTSWSTQRVINTSERSCEYEYTGLQENTDYQLRVRLVDKAGNITKPGEDLYLEIKTQASNVAPIFGSANTYVKEKTLKSLLIAAKATDKNGDRLTYNFYFGVTTLDELSSANPTETKTALPGEEVTFLVANELMQKYTDYAWTISVSDGLQTVYLDETLMEDKPITQNTMCDGKGYWCCPENSLEDPCSECGGKRYFESTETRTYLGVTKEYIVWNECSTCAGKGWNIIENYCTNKNHKHSRSRANYSVPSSYECEDCRGTGILNDSYYREENADGEEIWYLKHYCFSCNGTGVKKGIKAKLESCIHGMSVEDGSHECCWEHVNEKNADFEDGEYTLTRPHGNNTKLALQQCEGKSIESTCPNCKGKGITLDGNQEITCTTCKGTKKVISNGCKHGYKERHEYIGRDTIHKATNYSVICDGKGYYCCGPRNKYEKCIVCNQKGYIFEENSNGVKVRTRCSNCRGNGYVSESVTCENSEHKHIGSSNYSYYEIVSHDCTTCKGSGLFSKADWEERYPDKNINEYANPYCLECNGTGKYKEPVLKACKHGKTGSHECCNHSVNSSYTGFTTKHVIEMKIDDN